MHSHVNLFENDEFIVAIVPKVNLAHNMTKWVVDTGVTMHIFRCHLVKKLLLVRPCEKLFA